MTTSTRNDPSFIYHNSYENSYQTLFQNQILPLKDPMSDMSFSREAHDDAVANDPALQRFTATGRPIPHPKESREGRAWQAMAGADSLGLGPANFGPVRFTDDSILTIAVLPPDDTKSKALEGASDEDNNPVKEEPKKKFGFFRRKSSAYSEKKDSAFAMKKVSRGDYLKYYAKDNDGNYTGTMDPAPDCILNNEKDRFKKRKAFAFREANSTGLAGNAVMIDRPWGKPLMYADPEFAKYYKQAATEYHNHSATQSSLRTAAGHVFGGSGMQFSGEGCQE